MAGSSKLVVLITLLAAVSTVSAQQSCYQCSGHYTIDSGEDVGNCFTTTADTSTQANCEGQCSTTITLESSSILLQRGCQRTDDIDECNDCSNKEDCLLCCNSENCNSDALLNLLEEKALTQTCYSCRFSEIAGVKSYSSCAFDFREGGDGVETVHCPGMCYSSLAYIGGVEDIVRGCAYFGNDCDNEYYESGKNSILERNQVHFKRSCCLGDKCNSAFTINPGLFTLMISIILGMFVCYGV